MEKDYESISGRTSGDIIVVCGAKGGISKSTTSVNLAVGMAERFNRSIGIVDLDIPFSNISSLMRFHPDKSWNDFKNSESILEQFSYLRGNIMLMSCPVNFNEEPQFPEQEVVEKVIKTLAKTGDVIVDCGHAIDEYAKTACRLATKILLVSTPDQISIRNALAFLQMVKTTAKIEWVVSMVPGRLPFKLKEFEQQTKIPVAMVLPEMPQMKKLALKGELMIEKLPKSPWSKQIFSYLDKLENERRASLEEQSEQTKKFSWFKRVFAFR